MVTMEGEPAMTQSISGVAGVYSTSMRYAPTQPTPTLNPLSSLTTDDWAAVSAAVGHPIGPDAKGNLPKVAPYVALVIAGMRRSGEVGPATPLSASTLQDKLVGVPIPAVANAQVTGLMNYLSPSNVVSSMPAASGRLDIRA